MQDDLEVIDTMAKAIRDTAAAYLEPPAGFDLARDQALAAYRSTVRRHVAELWRMGAFVIQGDILATFEDEGRAFVVVKDQRGDRIIVAVADAQTVKT